MPNNNNSNQLLVPGVQQALYLHSPKPTIRIHFDLNALRRQHEDHGIVIIDDDVRSDEGSVDLCLKVAAANSSSLRSCTLLDRPAHRRPKQTPPECW